MNPTFFSQDQEYHLKISEETTCLSTVPAGYHLMRRWFYLHNKLTEQKGTIELTPAMHLTWTHQDTHNLAESGIYSSEEL
jgi:hypothetical protein